MFNTFHGSPSQKICADQIRTISILKFLLTIFFYSSLLFFDFGFMLATSFFFFLCIISLHISLNPPELTFHFSPFYKRNNFADVFRALKTHVPISEVFAMHTFDLLFRLSTFLIFCILIKCSFSFSAFFSFFEKFIVFRNNLLIFFFLVFSP